MTDPSDAADASRRSTDRPADLADRLAGRAARAALVLARLAGVRRVLLDARADRLPAGRGFGALSDGDTGAVYWFALGVFVAETRADGRRSTSARSRGPGPGLHMQTLLRANLLTAQVASGGPEAGQPVGSAGEALTHFRDDTEDIAMLVDGIVDVSGGLVFTVAAGFLLGSAERARRRRPADPARRRRAHDEGARRADQALPGRRPGGHGGRHRARRRHHGGGHDGEGQRRDRRHARPAARPRRRAPAHGRARPGARRGRHGVQPGRRRRRSRARAARQRRGARVGAFDVGTLALFVAYLGWLGFLPRMVGRMLARRKQAAIAVDRMRQLVAGRARRATCRAARAADRAPPARRAPAARSPGAGAARASSRSSACRRVTPAAPASTTSRSRCAAATSSC